MSEFKPVAWHIINSDPIFRALAAFRLAIIQNSPKLSGVPGKPGFKIVKKDDDGNP